MRSYPLAPLCYIFSFLTPALAIEYHAGHGAVHQTMIWQRAQPMKQAASNADHSMMNMSTAIVDYSSEYAGVIGVGTNSDGSSQFEPHVIFDTGSTNLWVASRLCTTCGPTWKERALQFYDPQKSTTQAEFLDTTHQSLIGMDIAVQFGSERLQGPLHVDTFRVGPFELKQQTFAMIREMNTFSFEGIVGLGFPDMSIDGVTPFFDRVIEQKLLKNNEFAFFMNADSTKPSAVLWGGVDKDLYEGEIQMFPVVQPHYWALELVDFLVGNTTCNTSLVGNTSMYSKTGFSPVTRLIVDSGTTVYAAPSGVHMELMQRIPPVSCDKIAAYPDLTYVLRSSDGELSAITVSSDAYMISDAKNNCEAGFVALDIEEPLGPAMMFGKTFMQRYFTVFSRGDGDVKNAKVGFAAAKIDASPKMKPAKTSSFLETDSLDAVQSDIRRVKREFDFAFSLDSRAQMRTSEAARARAIREH